MLGLKEFDKVHKHENAVKPIGMFFFCHGVPDENSRLSKTLDFTIQHFKKIQSGCVTPLSKALSGILLPHEKFGTHLDSSRKTINTNLEKRNFKAAGEILAKVWEEIVLDNFLIVAEYVENAAKDPVDLKEKWISAHCRISQYLLQIVRCNDSKSCRDFRTTWKCVFSSHFLPATVPALASVSDVKASDRFVDLWKRIGIQQLICNPGFSQMPYDLCCPRQDGCDLEVLGNKVIDEEDISHEGEENSEILVADGDDDHAPLINIYELLMNSEFIKIQTDRDDWIIYLLSRYDIHVYV